MSDIEIGDRVQWREPFKNTKEEPRMMTGTVISIRSTWAGISVDADGCLGGTWVRDLSKLTKIEAEGGAKQMNTHAPGFNPDDEPHGAWGDEQERELHASYSGKVNATSGPWEICEFGPNHPDALPGEVGVFAPKHPDSQLKEDGTWHGLIICRGMTGPAKRDNATLIAATPQMYEYVLRKAKEGDADAAKIIDSIG